MTVEAIVRHNARRRRLAVLLHSLLAFVYFHVVVFAFYVPFFFVFLFIIRTESVWLVSYGFSGLLLVLGLRSKSAQHDISESLYRPVYESRTSYELVVRRAVSKVTGIAYIISQIIYAAAEQISRAIQNYRRIITLDTHELREAEAIIDRLRRQDPRHRFIPVEQLDADLGVIGRLAIAEILWYQFEDEQVLVGLNRKYD